MTKLWAGLIAIVLFVAPSCRNDSQEELRRDTSSTVTPSSTSAPSSKPESPEPEPADPATQRRTWDGPDEAVQSFFSDVCRREVLMYGQQVYFIGDKTTKVAPDVKFLGYSRDEQQLWGDIGSPSVLYVTADAGKTFQEWRASSEQC